MNLGELKNIVDSQINEYGSNGKVVIQLYSMTGKFEQGVYCKGVYGDGEGNLFLTNNKPNTPEKLTVENDAPEDNKKEFSCDSNKDGMCSTRDYGPNQYENSCYNCCIGCKSAIEMTCSIVCPVVAEHYYPEEE